MLVMKMILHSSNPIGAMLGGFMHMTIKLRQKTATKTVLNRTLVIEFAPHHKQQLVHPLDVSKDVMPGPAATRPLHLSKV
jgi:hypothetical protein